MRTTWTSSSWSWWPLPRMWAGTGAALPPCASCRTMCDTHGTHAKLAGRTPTPGQPHLPTPAQRHLFGPLLRRFGAAQEVWAPHRAAARPGGQLWRLPGPLGRHHRVSDPARPRHNRMASLQLAGPANHVCSGSSGLRQRRPAPTGSAGAPAPAGASTPSFGSCARWPSWQPMVAPGWTQPSSPPTSRLVQIDSFRAWAGCTAAPGVVRERAGVLAAAPAGTAAADRAARVAALAEPPPCPCCHPPFRSEFPLLPRLGGGRAEGRHWAERWVAGVGGCWTAAVWQREQEGLQPLALAAIAGRSWPHHPPAALPSPQAPCLPRSTPACSSQTRPPSCSSWPWLRWRWACWPCPGCAGGARGGAVLWGSG